MKKQSIAAIFAAAALFCSAAMTAEGEQARIGGTKEKRRYLSFSEMRAYASAHSVEIMPVSECYTKESYEMGLDEEILAEMQGYVLQGEFNWALTVHREEELLIDSEELLAICPEFVQLMEEWTAENIPSFVDYYTDTDNIDQIYALDLDEKEGKELLLWYEDSDRVFLLQQAEAGFSVRTVRIDTGSGIYGARESRQMVIFSGGENTYYLLANRPSNPNNFGSVIPGLVLGRFGLQDDGQFAYEYRLIVQDRMPMAVRYLYADNRNILTYCVKEYIEENAALFAYKLWREQTIWGDEEMPQLAKEEQKKVVQSQVEDFSSYDEESLLDWYMRSYAVGADYDNDGSIELFWRDKGGSNKLLVEQDGGYRAEYVNLYGEGDCPVSQMWFMEFSGKTVTFEITEPYGKEYPVLSAYLIEGESRIPIVTCQLVYKEAVLIEPRRSSYGRNEFDVRKELPLFEGLEEAEEAAKTWWAENLAEQVEESKGAFSVTYAQEETPLPEGLLALVRQEYTRILSGEVEKESCLEPYMIDTKEDREEFLQYENWSQELEPYWMWIGDGDAYPEELCYWAYRWASSDGTVNYLVSEDCDGTFGAVFLEWYRDEGAGMVHKDNLCMYFRGDSSRMIAYEGKVYCVTTDYDFGTKMLTGMNIVALGEAGEWEHYYLSLSVDAGESSAKLLYGEELPDAVSAYVKEVYSEVLSACAEYRIYKGRGGSGEISREAARFLKNLGEHFDYYTDSDDVSPYIAADVDNDGTAEYFRTYYYYPSSYHGSFYQICSMYGYRDGEFGGIPFDGIIEDLAPQRSFLWQLWFEEFDGVTYLFTVEGLPNSQNSLLRVRLIKDGEIKDVGVFMLQVKLTEEISRNE